MKDTRFQDLEILIPRKKKNKKLSTNIIIIFGSKLALPILLGKDY
jgi:hypothetical protein